MIIPTDQLAAILDKHGKWLRNEDGGERADLRGVDLHRAKLRVACLGEADLRKANLYSADLGDAYLGGADLRGAILGDAYLRRADLRGACLVDANLRGADLRDAYLCGANLRGANLSGANLSGANLHKAILGDDESRFAEFRIVPEGDLIGWKKCEGDVLVKLRIPAAARRMNAVGSRKCRAEWAEVLELSEGEVAVSTHNGKTQYRVGKTVYPDSFDPDIRVECSHGIHFFITKEEAEAW